MSELEQLLSRLQVAHVEFIDEMNGGDCDCLTHQFVADLQGQGLLNRED